MAATALQQAADALRAGPRGATLLAHDAQHPPAALLETSAPAALHAHHPLLVPPQAGQQHHHSHSQQTAAAQEHRDHTLANASAEVPGEGPSPP